MADERIDIDVSGALRDIAQLNTGLSGLQAGAKKAGAAFNDAFKADEAQGVADALDDLQKQYESLKKSADTLKTSLKNATNPELIKLYASNIAKLEAGMKRLEDTGKAAGVNLQKVNKEAGTGRQVFENFFGAFTKASIIIAAIEAVIKFTSYAVGLSESLNKSRKQFEAFTGSAAEADKIVQQLTETGMRLGLPTDELLKAGKSLLAFGEEADNLPRVLSQIADVSAATGKELGALTEIYGRSLNAGTVSQDDLNQLFEAGVFTLKDLAKQMGITEDQVKQLGSQGKISFEELQLALFDATQEGGKFADQAEKNLDTLGGAWNKLLAKLQPGIAAVGGFLSDLAQGFILNVTNIIEGIESLFDKSGKAAIKNAQELNDEGKEEMYASRREYEKDIQFRDELDRKTKEKREALAKANAAELAKIEKERNALRIQAMKDGEEKEIAIENARFAELKKQLEKYHLDTKEATEQHEQNILKIQAKYFVERFNAEQEAIELQKEQEQELIDFDNKQAADRVANAKKRAEDIFNVRESEINLLEQQYANYLAQMRSDGADEKAIGEQQIKFDNVIQAERIKNQIAFQEAILSTLDAGDKAAIEQAKNNISRLKAALEGVSLNIPRPDGSGGTLFEGLGFNEDQIAEIQRGADNLISIINDVSAAQVEKAERAIDAANREQEAARAFYDEQKALNEQGFANDFDLAERRLQAAAQQEERAIAQKKKAQRQQILIESALQAANIATAASQTFKQFPGALTPIAVGLVALMIGAFIASKARALQATKFRDGGGGRVDGRGIIVGNSHESGGVGFEAEGGEFFTTNGERFGIVNKRMTAKHFDLLQAINTDNRDKMRDALAALVAPIDRDRVIGAAGGSVAVVVGKDRDTYNLLKDWKKEAGKRKTVTVANGYIIEQVGNATRKIRIR
jgi:tape measure domain-containing protein